MKKDIARTLLTLSLLAILAGSSVYAQSSSVVKVNIPFDFRVGSQSLPAGAYTVTPVKPSLVMIRNKDGQEFATSVTNTVQANQISVDGKLIFNQYGKSFYLSQVWTPGEEIGRKLIQSSAEQEVATGTKPIETSILIARKAKK